KALTDMQILSNANKAQLASLDPARDKIYILGHGGPGNPYLHSTPCDKEEKIPPGYLAEELKLGGLSRNFRDFRLTSCNSADAREPLSFSHADLRAATLPKLGHRSWLLCGAQSEAKVALAQTFSETLSLLGFNNAEVTGYHGSGKVFSLANCSTQEIKGDIARRSSVKSTYKADELGHAQIIQKHSVPPPVRAYKSFCANTCGIIGVLHRKILHHLH
ncbi:hypothetical protein WAE56_20815, partial [Iodobacter sp. LRB]